MASSEVSICFTTSSGFLWAGWSLLSLSLISGWLFLGNLFRSKRFQRNETELVILITPYLVQPVRSRTLATPLDARPQGATTASAGPRNDGVFGFYMN